MLAVDFVFIIVKAFLPQLDGLLFKDEDRETSWEERGRKALAFSTFLGTFIDLVFFGISILGLVKTFNDDPWRLK
jgi:hypothetical protein